MAETAGDLGARVTRARLERGVTQAQLAEYLHVKQASISMLESGELEPTDHFQAALEAWLASGSSPRRPAPRGPREHYVTQSRSTIRR